MIKLRVYNLQALVKHKLKKTMFRIGIAVLLSMTAIGVSAVCGCCLGTITGVARASTLLRPLLSICGIGMMCGTAAFFVPHVLGDENKKG